MRTNVELAETMVELADSLTADFDGDELLERLAARCVDALDLTGAGLLLGADHDGLRVLACTTAAVEVLERFGLDADEGPGRDAYVEARRVVNVDAAERAHRWPAYTARARCLGITAVHAVPMRSRSVLIGALTLCSADDRPLDATAVVVAQSFADVATIAILQHRAIDEAHTLTDQLSGALISRIALEQAKGVVAGSVGLTMDDAFRRLRMHARNHNLGLNDVANDVISGALSTTALDPLPVGPPDGTRRRRRRGG